MVRANVRAAAAAAASQQLSLRCRTGALRLREARSPERMRGVGC